MTSVPTAAAPGPGLGLQTEGLRADHVPPARPEALQPLGRASFQGCPGRRGASGSIPGSTQGMCSPHCGDHQKRLQTLPTAGGPEVLPGENRARSSCDADGIGRPPHALTSRAGAGPPSSRSGGRHGSCPLAAPPGASASWGCSRRSRRCHQGPTGYLGRWEEHTDRVQVSQASPALQLFPIPFSCFNSNAAQVNLPCGRVGCSCIQTWFK